MLKIGTYKYKLQVKFPDFLGIKSDYETILSFDNKNDSQRWIDEYKSIFKNAIDIRVISQ